MRTIYLIGEIDSDAVHNVAKQLDIMSASAPHKPITIKISSGGGELYQALALVGLIRSCGAPVHAEAYGQVMSAAVLVFAACDVRKAHSATWFMVHESQLPGIKGSTSEVARETQQHVLQDRHWNTLMAQFTKEDVDFWSRLDKQQRHFLAAEAKSYGLVDEVTEGY